MIFAGELVIQLYITYPIWPKHDPMNMSLYHKEISPWNVTAFQPPVSWFSGNIPKKFLDPLGKQEIIDPANPGKLVWNPID